MTVQPADAASPLICPLCNKLFSQAHTRKRHLYYCLKKQSKPPLPRTRSCRACIKAKARCTWLDDLSAGCARCHERKKQCEYGVQPLDASSLVDDSPMVPLVRNDAAHDTNPFKTIGTISWPDFADAAQQIDLLNNWDLTSRRYELGSLAGSFQPDLLAFSPPQPALQVGTTSFDPRALVKPGHSPIVSLLRRMLSSYPLRLLRKETFPPFVSQLMYSKAEAGQGPSLKSLLHCVSLLQMYKIQASGDRAFVWKMIALEEKRIHEQQDQFDRWELLAAQQSLLVYCLLRMMDPEHPRQQDDHIQVTIRLVASSLSTMVGGMQAFEAPDAPDLEWQEWLFNESRRRTVTILRILNMVVDISFATACRPMEKFALIPLHSNATLWRAGALDKWQSEMELCYQERTIYGLAETGELVKLQQTLAGIQSSVMGWEQWVADTGEMGTLVMVAGELLADGAKP